jgi:hypothetical protein
MLGQISDTFMRLELLAVTLPGAVALIVSWRHLRAN